MQSQEMKRREQKSEQGLQWASYPDGARMYCIGDIHGHADLLEQLHGMIGEDAANYSGEKHLLYVGDYVDRGMQSRQVIEMLLDHPLAGFETTFLKGNHEQAMLDFMQAPEATSGWLLYGGRETLYSYGVVVPGLPSVRNLRGIAADLAEALPESHRAFLESGHLSWTAGDYHFVHAGIRPGIPLDRQLAQDQMWIREEFTLSEKDHGAVVVHGHTICDEVEFRRNRIGIDTGAFHTGVLTCLVLEGKEQRLLQTGKGRR